MSTVSDKLEKIRARIVSSSISVDVVDASTTASTTTSKEGDHAQQHVAMQASSFDPGQVERPERVHNRSAAASASTSSGSAVTSVKSSKTMDGSQPQESAPPAATHARVKPTEPSLEPYVGKLERYELFSTNQCYYLVGCNKLNTAYRVLKMDRTLIERPPEHQASRKVPATPTRAPLDAGAIPTNESQATMADNSHAAKPTLRPLSDFLTEDPNVYSQDEIKDMLDMIHDGNRMTRADGAPGDVSGSKGGGLKPIVKAYGVVGFIRFLDCYYLTLITRRAKVGSVGGNGVYTVKVSAPMPIDTTSFIVYVIFQLTC